MENNQLYIIAIGTATDLKNNKIITLMIAIYMLRLQEYI